MFILLQNTILPLNSEVSVAIIAAAATILVSTLTLVISRYYQSKREQESAHRDKKVVLYDKFTKELFNVFFNVNKKKSGSDELVTILREIHRQLILWSGPNAIKAYSDWHKALTEGPVRAEHMIKMVDFFLALRKDLGHSNKGLEYSHMVRFVLRNSELFMREYKKNPKISLAELNRLEKEIDALGESKKKKEDDIQ